MILFELNHFRKIIAREVLSRELFSSEPIWVTLSLLDDNDNAPKFSSGTYHVVVADLLPTNATDLKAIVDGALLSFNATDEDSGAFGSRGFKCSLFGDGAKKFVMFDIKINFNIFFLFLSLNNTLDRS